VSARDRIRKYFEENVRKVVKTADIRRVAGISEYARRIRELRNQEGMRIKSHRDLHYLKPGEYILETLERSPQFGEKVSAQLRTQILERNGYTCQVCGAGSGDTDPVNPNRKIRLHIDHIVPISRGGTSDPDNLRVLCSACNQGRANIQTPTESTKNLLARIRREPRKVQREVYEALKRSIEPD